MLGPPNAATAGLARWRCGDQAVLRPDGDCWSDLSYCCDGRQLQRRAAGFASDSLDVRESEEFLLGTYVSHDGIDANTGTITQTASVAERENCDRNTNLAEEISCSG